VAVIDLYLGGGRSGLSLIEPLARLGVVNANTCDRQ
jgi:hypothetical protein